MSEEGGEVVPMSSFGRDFGDTYFHSPRTATTSVTTTCHYVTPDAHLTGTGIGTGNAAGSLSEEDYELPAALLLAPVQVHTPRSSVVHPSGPSAPLQILSPPDTSTDTDTFTFRADIITPTVIRALAPSMSFSSSPSREWSAGDTLTLPEIPHNITNNISGGAGSGGEGAAPAGAEFFSPALRAGHPGPGSAQSPGTPVYEEIHGKELYISKLRKSTLEKRKKFFQ